MPRFKVDLLHFFTMPDMKERLLKIITAEGLTRALLADKMGVQRTRITHLLSGRNLPSFDSLQKLLINFPKLNAEWLILGQGSMYKLSDEVIPDIFSSSGTPESPEKTLVSPTIPEKTQNLSSVEGNQKKPPEHGTEIWPLSEPKKNIEKMVVLYTDKTFATYYPET